MLFLLLAELDTFLYLLSQLFVHTLGLPFAPLHQLHRKGKAKDPGNEGIFQHFAHFRLHVHAAVLFPDPVMSLFLFRKAQ